MSVNRFIMMQKSTFGRLPPYCFSRTALYDGGLGLLTQDMSMPPLRATNPMGASASHCVLAIERISPTYLLSLSLPTESYFQRQAIHQGFFKWIDFDDELLCNGVTPSVRTICHSKHAGALTGTCRDTFPYTPAYNLRLLVR